LNERVIAFVTVIRNTNVWIFIFGQRVFTGIKEEELIIILVVVGWFNIFMV
jgi:hypothetical protein